MITKDKTKKLMFLLLAVIFLVYIGVGISNSLLGAAWPAVSADIGVPVSWQSLIIVITYSAAAVGSASAEKLLVRFGTFFLIAFGLAIMAIAIFAYAATQLFGVLIGMGILLGFGVGLEQSVGNGFLAKHYSAAAMSWLHCTYAMGCMLAPVILSYFIINETWRRGYQIAGSIQIAFFAVVLITVPFWRVIGSIFPKRRGKVTEEDSDTDEAAPRVKSIPELLRIPGGTIIPLTFFFYCSFEVSIFFWATSFLSTEKGMSPGVAAGMMIYLYVGQVVGRAMSGVVSLKVSDRIFIRVMMILVLAATILFLISDSAMLPPIFFFLGFATGPIFPLIIHEVPSIVGAKNAQGIIGIQISASATGTAFVPLLLGIIAGKVGFWIFGVFLIVLIVTALTLKLIQDWKYR